MLLSVCALLVAAVVSVAPALAAAPEAPVAEAQSHTATNAFLHGVLNPGVEPPQEGTYEFLYAASPSTCTGESKGTRGLALGYASQEVGEEIGGLSQHTTYTICLLHRNLAGEETLSAPVTFTTSFEPETPEATVADAITSSTAMLHGELNPNASREEEPGSYEFIYARGGGCEGEGSTGQLPATTGGEKEPAQAEIAGLVPGAQYAFCVRAWNTTGQYAQGGPVTFTTLPAKPSVSEETVSNVDTSRARVSAQIATGGLSVTYSVQYGTTEAYGQETTPVEVPASTSSLLVQLSGLQPGSEYHFRFRLSNNEGEEAGPDTTFKTVAQPVEGGSNGGEGCLNEQIREEQGSTYLPDCRAYEQVTPSFKAGYMFHPNSFSSDGNRAMIRSTGSVAGELGTGETAVGGSIYLDTRTPAGWTLAPLNASQARYAGQIPLSVEADSGMSLWVQNMLGQPPSTRDLYLRSSFSSKDFTRVGPLNPHVNVGEEPGNSMNTGLKAGTVGATSDYGHILVQPGGAGDDWPFDSTVGVPGSLYEYSGTGNQQPVLVGVEGPKGSTQLIGLCGAALGAGFNYGGLAYNALSRDGETIFFTVLPKGLANCSAAAPAYPALYARIHGALTSSQSAETVDVSARAPEPFCSGSCRTNPESGANFQGASEDGGRVYFTSTQQLVNEALDTTVGGNSVTNEGCPKTEGGMGVCNLYEYDFNSPEGTSPLRVVSAGDMLGVAGIAEDGSHVYFVSRAKIASTATNPYGREAREGAPNLYVYDAATGQTTYVATLAERDGTDWEYGFQRPVEVSGEAGRYVLFASSAPGVTPDETSEQAQLYEYKAASAGEAAELVRVTQGEDGYAENGNGVTAGVNARRIAGAAERLGNRSDFRSTTNPLNISENGRTVVFETAGQLSPRAVSAAEGCTSVYEFRVADGVLADGVVRLLSDGQDVAHHNADEFCGAEFQRMDASGSDVLIVSGDSLVSNDVDSGLFDIYDVREGGGFAVPVAASSCEGGGCEGAVSMIPVFAAPTTTTFAAQGNLRVSPVVSRLRKQPRKVVKCQKGRRRKGARCVKVKGRRGRTVSGRALRGSVNGGRGR
ncbi:MAG: hypothetical protein ACRDJ3_01905 [Solirubrobacteraceae bacterium]